MSFKQLKESQVKYSEISRFYIPLALQAVSQSFTYPLVAIVAARGEDGAMNIAALGQAHVILFFLLSFGAGLITSGMVYCVNSEGYKRFNLINKCFMFFILIIQALACIPQIADIIFSSIMGLEGKLYKSTYLAFLLSIPFPLMFNFRNISLVVLLNHKKTGKAFSATLSRILSTIILSLIFTYIGLTGIFWAAICQSIPILFEVFLMNFFAKEIIRKIKSLRGDSASLSEMVILTFSFSAGKVLMAFSGYAVAAFAARAPDPTIMLPAYYAASGICNPLAFAASRIQATVISFAVKFVKNIRLFNFSIIVGLITGLIPLIFTLPLISDWYYVTLQKIPFENMKYVRQTAFFLVLIPFSVALRSYVEGWAAFRRKPTSVIAGQGVYLGMVVSTAFFAFNLGCQGNIIGPIALFIGNISAAGILALTLKINEKEEIKPQVSQYLNQV